MMRAIVAWSLQYRLPVIAVAVGMLVFGIAQLPSIPVDTLPEFAPPYVEIQTEALGLSAAEVENLVTLGLEDFLQSTPWLQTMHSRSVPGLSSIILVFEPGTDITRARQFVQERLTVASFLPHVSKAPTMLQPLSANSRVMMVGLSSDRLSEIEMSVLARWKIRPALMGQPGVANVAMWGQRRRQLQVQVDPERLRAHNVSLDQVIRSTGNALWFSPLTYLNASYPGTGGWVDTPQQRLGIRHVLPISTASDLANVAVDELGRTLGDVGETVESYPLLIGDAVLKEKPGVLLVIEKFPGSNTLEVTRRVEATLASLQPALPGMTVDTTVYRHASYIEMAAANLTTSLVISALLLILALLALLFRFRAAFISMLAILVSLLAAVLVLKARGATLNAMALAGFAIALAILVDDAIVGVEGITSRLRAHLRGGGDRSPTTIGRIILDASAQLRGPIGFATLIMLLAVSPVFFLEGVTGAFFRPLAVSYALALLASMVVALTLTPVLALTLLGNPSAERRESPAILWLRRRYTNALSRTLGRPRLIYIPLAVLVVLGVAVLPFLGRSLLPQFKERDVLVQWDGAPGTSHPEMSRIADRASAELRSLPGVRAVSAHVGRAVLGDQVIGMHSGQLWVSIDPRANYDATLAAIRDTVAGYPGLVGGVQTYTQSRIREILGKPSDALVVRIYGPDYDVLRSKGEEVSRSLARLEGIVDPRLEQADQEPRIEVKVDLAKVQAYGIGPGDVRRAAGTLVNGLEVGSLYEEQKVFDVVVWAIPSARQSLTNIRELLIDTPAGSRVRLGEVADIRLVPAPPVIRHQSNSRYVEIAANVRPGRDAGSVAADVERALQSIQFPLDHHAELVRSYAEQQAAQRHVFIAGIVAAIAIFLLLQAAFNSWRLAIMAFLALPVAVVGGLLAVFVSGTGISLGALAGFLAVLGIATRNGVVLINHYQRLETEESEAEKLLGRELILRGAQDRVAPIAMTALTVGLALLPLAIAGSIPGHEIVYPLAIAVLGGLVTSTFLNLFVVPALYLRYR